MYTQPPPLAPERFTTKQTSMTDSIKLSADLSGLRGPVTCLLRPISTATTRCCRQGASIKSFRRREDREKPPDDDPGNPWVGFRGAKLKNETHESRMDPEARLMRKGKGREARLSFMGHALMENGNGLLMNSL